MLDSIVSVLGIIGFIFSLINFVYFFIIRKKHLIIKFGEYGIRNFRDDKKLLIIDYRFDNASQLPISITNVQILIDNKFFDCYNRKTLAEEMVRKSNGIIIGRNISYTDKMPINLNSLASQSGFLAFPIPQDKLSVGEKSLNFRICTNRGKAIQKTFVLHAETKCR